MAKPPSSSRRRAASIPATRPSRSSNCGASGSWRAARRRSTTARRLSSTRADRQQLEAAGRRPHWRFLLEAARWAGTTSSVATQADRHRHPVGSGAHPRGRQLSLHPAIGRRRHRSRHHPRHPRRGPCRQHRGADPAVRGARGQAAAIRPSQPADRRRWPGAVETARLAVDRRHARAGDRGDGGGERCGADRDLGVGSPGRRL